ncbi:MAG: aminotransferase class V-fold PLP-dependent enzyme, partial [Firmicutes bacterium]|nr:aminotransferase class V-fold PLP-dependent enzyme [Bacillota bacterium]
RKTAVVAINIEGMDCEKAATMLNDKYGIAVRAGFHCSCMAHRTIGTEETGCIRICPGFYTSEKEIDEVIRAVREIAEGR